MRNTKRFTPKVLSRFHREGRGTGAYGDYTGWHRVTRGDPSSRGFSSVVAWRGLHLDFLSNGEHTAFLFATMLPELEDVREQFPLADSFVLDQRQFLLGLDTEAPLEPGTLSIAESLGYKHPVLKEHGQLEPWIMTTDLLLFLKGAQGEPSALAVAVKDGSTAWRESRRTHELLAIEHEYWRRRGIPWILLTPSQWDARVFRTLQRIACWGLGAPVSAESRRVACEIARTNPNANVTDLVRLIRSHIAEGDAGERALWQAVWFGDLPVDLRRSWRPHLPLIHLSQQAFLDQNPLAMRRSAWT